MITVYHYPRCSTCRKAILWLGARGVEVTLVDLVATPPAEAVLERVLRLTGLPVQKLFNTSGELYRQGNYKEKLATLTEQQALAALACEGKLIKRPLVVGDDFALVGFREAEYEARFN